MRNDLIGETGDREDEMGGRSVVVYMNTWRKGSEGSDVKSPSETG